MRKLLLATAAMLGATSGIASAQAPTPAAIFAPSQGMTPMPGNPTPPSSSFNQSNAYGNVVGHVGGAAYAAMKPPAPGTVVIHFGGKVEVDMDAFWSTGNQVITSDGKVYKINPVVFGSFMRLYPGVDGMATNGLRYGASVELRQNFMSGNNYAFTGNTASAATVGAAAGFTPGGNTIGTGAASGSGNTSAETVFVRRAFTYLANDNLGIVRFGTTDGVIGLFDPGIFSSATWDAGVGNFNGGMVQAADADRRRSPFPSPGWRRRARNTATPRWFTCRRSSSAWILACSMRRAWATASPTRRARRRCRVRPVTPPVRSRRPTRRPRRASRRPAVSARRPATTRPVGTIRSRSARGGRVCSARSRLASTRCMRPPAKRATPACRACCSPRAARSVSLARRVRPTSSMTT